MRVMFPLLFSAILTCACASLPKGLRFTGDAGSNISMAAMPLEEPNNDQGPDDFREALKNFEASKFQEAADAFKKFYLNQSTSKYAWISRYYYGYSIEMLGRNEEAIEVYREVIQATVSRGQFLRAKTLYRMSFCYERMSNDIQVVASLKDIGESVKYLPESVRLAELFARIAGAYARLGNQDEAIKYYELAEAGIGQLKRKHVGMDSSEWFAKTLFAMGSLEVRDLNWQNFDREIEPFGRSQIYLFRSVVANSPNWSPRSEQMLLNGYQRLQNVIINQKPTPTGEDPIVSQREIVSRQNELIQLVLTKVQELEIEATTGENSKDFGVKILAKLEPMVRQFNEMLAEPLPGSGLTDEALKRKTLPRGSTKNPEDANLEGDPNQ